MRNKFSLKLRKIKTWVNLLCNKSSTNFYIQCIWSKIMLLPPFFIINHFYFSHVLKKIMIVVWNWEIMKVFIKLSFINDMRKIKIYIIESRDNNKL